jgi:hypothetical protein
LAPGAPWEHSDGRDERKGRSLHHGGCATGCGPRRHKESQEKQMMSRYPMIGRGSYVCRVICRRKRRRSCVEGPSRLQMPECHRRSSRHSCKPPPVRLAGRQVSSVACFDAVAHLYPSSVTAGEPLRVVRGSRWFRLEPRDSFQPAPEPLEFGRSSDRRILRQFPDPLQALPCNLSGFIGLLGQIVRQVAHTFPPGSRHESATTASRGRGDGHTRLVPEARYE